MVHLRCTTIFFVFALTPLLLSAGQTEPWLLTNPKTPEKTQIRILIVHDMEGLSGQDDPESMFYQFDSYGHAQTLLAADINSAVDGFFAGGATEVHVTDGHGSGNPEPDLPPELLDPRAVQLLRESAFDPYLGLVREDYYDAVAVVGQHARTGSGGFAAHTLTLGMDLRFNNTPITETEFLALSWGRKNIPVIFASGDDVLARLLQKSMPWAEVAVTKYAIDAGKVRLRPIKEARDEIRSKAQRAVENLSKSRAMRIIEPMVVTLRTVPPADIRSMKGIPGVDYFEPDIVPGDAAVSFLAETWDLAIEGMWALVAVARGGYLNHTIEQYEREGQHRKFDEFYEKRFRVWLEQESGRLKPSPVENHGRPLPKLHHGVR